MKNSSRTLISISPPKRILILCEGESEQIYLKGIQSEPEHRRHLTGLVVYQPHNHSPVGLVKEAKKKIREANKDKQPFQSVWIVFDKDGHQNIPNAFEQARTFSPQINIAFSSTCFEYWILLHFVQKKVQFSKCDDVKHLLVEKHFKEYEKTINFYPLIKEKQNKAISNSVWLRKQNQADFDSGLKEYEVDSYTGFDKLVQFLKKIRN